MQLTPIHPIQVDLAEATQEEREASFVHNVVSLTTLWMIAIESMVILLDTSFISPKDLT